MITLRSPCCNRKLKGASLLLHAAEQYHRTCPKCRRHFRVLVKPLGRIKVGYVHSVDWVRYDPKTGDTIPL